MREVLFLCHRIPYPPNKGDKIRAYHWLRALASRYVVHLGTFVDDPADWSGRDTVQQWCDQTCFRPLVPMRARLRSLNGLRRREALSFAYYRDARMSRWVKQLAARRSLDAVIAFSSTMGPYALSVPDVRRVLDFVDVDSDKWAQYARTGTAPMAWVHGREARKLAAAEERLADEFDASVFVSDAEADFFRHRAPQAGARIHAIANGVDADYFSAEAGFDRLSAPGHGARVVFTGAMDYGANVDAVCWFAEKVWPGVRAACADAQFTIVGLRPAARVRALAELDGIEVTGAVADVRPYLAAADVAVAPMRIARGIQNKVLEAFAMGLPVVMTPQAAAGLRPVGPEFADVVEPHQAFADAVLSRFGSNPQTAAAARGYVSRYYGWPARFDELLSLVEGASSTSQSSVKEGA
ncbi:TIGR03087 family PEP-CTERM/XrtA system glycosyltransferase [Salinisphaera sp. T31B1]|uniref:TIGR03087 family PEP-CTERM/XrtA system glycosyltransferase n=1 Tax=Salinisphaera sp. T31B1 TaxID=727963 RepID=UPI0033428394